MSTRPDTLTLPQLLHLVDRAVSGRLLPGEAQLLRSALERGDQAARSLGGAIAAQRRAQGALEDAERAVVALRGRYAPLTPLDVPCTRCRAEQFKRCIGGAYGATARGFHAERVRAIGSIAADRAVTR
jgi:hypothetical protein